MKEYFFIGSYIDDKSPDDRQGIGYWSVDSSTGGLAQENKTIAIKENTHFSFNRDYFYSANDIFNYQGENNGCLSVFKRNKNDQLERIQQVSSFGTGTVYTRLIANNKFLLTANYIAGNVLVYPIDSGGMLGQPVENIQHIGHSVNIERQESAHPHAIELSHDERYVYVADLGLDILKVYQFNHESGDLTARNDLDMPVELGSGPRHIRFHFNGKFAYVIHEMSNQLSAFRYDNGKLSLLKYYNLSNGDNESSTGAELHIHPNGQYIYATSRGTDCICVFSIDLDSGLLTLTQSISTAGSTPTSFAIAPNGQCLVVGNQLSNAMTSFIINKDDGLLTYTNQIADIEQPIMISFNANS